MKEYEFVIRELFAYYGRAVYQAQAIEKGILSLVLFKKLDNSITKTRYDELLYEKSKLTFGQLKRELILLKLFNTEELNEIHAFHKKRDYLIHNYWWDRAVEFSIGNSHETLFSELQSYTDFFDKLNYKVDKISFRFFQKHNLNFDHIKDELLSIGKTPKLNEFEKLKKNEILSTCKERLKDLPNCEISLDNIIVKAGHPVDEILSVALGGSYDVVVMGTHGQGKISRLLIGSVARGVVDKCEVPVLTIRLPVK